MRLLLAIALVLIACPSHAGCMQDGKAIGSCDNGLSDFVTVDDAAISAGDNAAITVGKGSTITSTNATFYGNDCVIRKDGLCLKLHDGWTGKITNEGGEEVINGEKMSDFPPCTKDRKTDCLAR
jgi:hypothetical protein